MKDNAPFLVLEYPCDQAVDWLTRQLWQAGLIVLRTFDLQSARQDQPLCPCPYHGTERCDCQLVVLLVYHNSATPMTITAHGYDQQTWFSIVDTPQQRADPRLEGIIRSLAVPLSLPVDPLENDASSK